MDIGDALDFGEECAIVADDAVPDRNVFDRRAESIGGVADFGDGDVDEIEPALADGFDELRRRGVASAGLFVEPGDLPPGRRPRRVAADYAARLVPVRNRYLVEPGPRRPMRPRPETRAFACVLADPQEGVPYTKRSPRSAPVISGPLRKRRGPGSRARPPGTTKECVVPAEDHHAIESEGAANADF